MDGASLIPADVSGLEGKTVDGRYRVLSHIGDGGMGQVYLAEHVHMKRKSAIKIMRPALLHEPEALQRFTREAENASRINHPNVASIFDFGRTDDGLVYLAMEFIEGESLAMMLKRGGALSPVVCADIMAQAAGALQAAHDLGILHRDVKPDNIMVTRRDDGTFLVKLVDFGIARSTERAAQALTRTGYAVGTPEYMSPEQLAGDVLDARSDQYSLALVTLQMLTGHLAFDDTSSKESLLARLTGRPRRLDAMRSDLDWPASLQDVFDKALAPDPVDRYPTVTQFGAAVTDSISEMTVTQTAEVYLQALGQRSGGLIARAPHDGSTGRPQSSSETPQFSGRTRRQEAHRQPRRDPVRMGRRRSVFPYIVLIGVLTYGVWWYGSEQALGTPMRNAADQIEAGWRKGRELVARWTRQRESTPSRRAGEPVASSAQRSVSGTGYGPPAVSKRPDASSGVPTDSLRGSPDSTPPREERIDSLY